MTIRTNLTELPPKLAQLADDLILGKIEPSAYYGKVRTLLDEAQTCGAVRAEKGRSCLSTVHHEDLHVFETERRLDEWSDAECIQVSSPQPLSRYAPIGSRVFCRYWGDHYDVLAIAKRDDGWESWVTVYNVEDKEIKSHLTSFDPRLDRVLGPIPPEEDVRCFACRTVAHLPTVACRD